MILGRSLALQMLGIDLTKNYSIAVGISDMVFDRRKGAKGMPLNFSLNARTDERNGSEQDPSCL